MENYKQDDSMWDLKRKVRRNTRAVASTRTVLSFEVGEINGGVHLLDN